MPALRARVGELFGGRIAAGVDPMTIVARGAALYAGSVGLDATPAARAPAPAAGPRRAHRAPVGDRRPGTVRGRPLPARDRSDAGQTPADWPDRVRIERDDGGWTGARREAVAGGQLRRPGAPRSQPAQPLPRARLRPRRRRGRAGDAARSRSCTASRSAIRRWRARIGVARADDSTHVYFAKGTPLPARRTFAHHTVRPIAAGSDDDALAVPIVQGESVRAHRNRLIGMLHLRGVARDLPAGSRIEVTLELDRSGQLATRADVPGTGQTFEDVAFVLVPTATVETAERELAATNRRAADVQRRTFQLGVPAAVQAIAEVSALLAEADRALPAARAGDSTRRQKLHRLLMDVNTRARRRRGAAGMARPRRRRRAAAS